MTALLDTESPIPGVISGTIRSKLPAIAVISRVGGGRDPRKLPPRPGVSLRWCCCNTRLDENYRCAAGATWLHAYGLSDSNTEVQNIAF